MIRVYRPLLVGYNAQADRKWMPEGMFAAKLYPVFGVEDGKLTRQDKTTGEATYFHFVGEGHKPCRLIQSNAVLVCVGDDEWAGLVREDGAGLWVHFMLHDAKAASGAAPAA